MVSFIQPTLRRLEAGPAESAVFFCFEELRPLGGIVSLIDWRLHGQLSRRMIDGFFAGAYLSPLLVLPGKRLPISFLMLLGLGRRETFGQAAYTAALESAFEIQRRLNIRKFALSLPGRVEDVVAPETAMDWFIQVYDRHMDTLDEIYIIEPQATQKIMVPALERWRLRRLIPGFNPA